MKIAVIGNSHVSMIRVASAEPEFAQCDFEWMARARKGTADFEVHGSTFSDNSPVGQRTLKNLGMATQLDVNHVDRVLILGNTLDVSEVAHLFRSCFIPAWGSPPGRRWPLPWRRNPPAPRPPLTEAAIHAALTSKIQSNLTFSWVSTLQAHTKTPIYVVPPVYAREAALDPKITSQKVFRLIVRLGDTVKIAKAFDAAHIAAFKDLPGVTVLLQDKQTVMEGFFTKDAFAKGSMRLDLAHEHVEQDILHGNIEFGRLILRRLLEDQP